MPMIIGLDLAKHVFQVHGVDAAGEDAVGQAAAAIRVVPFFRVS